MHEPPNDLLLVGGGEQVIVASGWAEFREFCDTHRDISLRLAGSTRGDSVAYIDRHSLSLLGTIPVSVSSLSLAATHASFSSYLPNFPRFVVVLHLPYVVSSFRR